MVITQRGSHISSRCSWQKAQQTLAAQSLHKEAWSKQTKGEETGAKVKRGVRRNENGAWASYSKGAGDGFGSLIKSRDAM